MRPILLLINIIKGLTGVVLLVIFFFYFWPLPTDNLVTQLRPAQDYQASLQRFKAWQEKEPVNTAPTGSALLMEHGRRVERSIVFFHGFTSSPRQFKELGEKFFQRGYNVFIPRLPQHGLNEQSAGELKYLTAEQLRKTADEAVDIARGLGERVTVVGLSMGGVIAGWVAQNRPDVDRVVVIAPNFGTYRVPNILLKPTIVFLMTSPNRFVWWDPKLKSQLKRPTGTYQGFYSRALGEIRRLGWAVQKASKENKPKAGSILVVTNANDQAVSQEGIDVIVNNWQRHSDQVQRFEFARDRQLGHDLIDPEQPNQQVESVYPRLITLITETYQR